MTKQELIQEAYGQHWKAVEEFVDKDHGSLDVHYWTINEIKIPFDRIGFGDRRPTSLKGIENNNGWIKIESISDLPSNDNGETLYESGKFMSDGDFEQRIKRSSVKSLKYYFLQNLITHYRPIEILIPPIY